MIHSPQPARARISKCIALRYTDPMIAETGAVSSRSISERRRMKRTALKKRASLIVKYGHHAQRIPCLILDTSKDGFKIGGASRLKRGQFVEIILDEHTSDTVLCRVRWVGKPGAKQGGEAGLQIKTGSV